MGSLTEAPPQKVARQTAEVSARTDEPAASGNDDPDMIGWTAEDVLLDAESDAVSVYHSLSESQTEEETAIPREYATVVPYVGDMEP
eukprot:2375895-Lingulodinium_polyedra.AAC.1